MRIFRLSSIALLLGALASASASAGYYFYPESGIVKACADGETTSAAIFPGRGYFLLRQNGNLNNAYPQGVMNGGWAPLLGGANLCWQRGLSTRSSQNLINSWNNYCVNQHRHFCRFQ